MREGKVLHGHGPVHDVTDAEVEAAAECLRSNIGMLGSGACFVNTSRIDAVARGMLRAARAAAAADA